MSADTETLPAAATRGRAAVPRSRYLLLGLYALAGLLLASTIFTFLYQYVAGIRSFSAVVRAFETPRILSALWLSVASALVTAGISLVFGVPLAYVLAMRDFRGKSLVESLAVDVPQTFPPVAEGMIFLLMLGPGSPFHVNLAFTFTALVIAKVFICAPFVVSFTSRRFREIRKTGINYTARSLGATPFQVFLTVLIPLALRDIAAGLSLCWSRAMGELGGSLLFAGIIPFKTEIIPTFISAEGKSVTVAALAATILVTTASTVALVSFKRFTRTTED